MSEKTSAPAAIILAGGQGKRMGGKRKAFLEIDGQPIIHRLLAVCRPLFSEIIISCREADAYRFRGVTTVTDRIQTRSSLTGIHAGLSAMRAAEAFVVACDTPFLKPELVRLLIEKSVPNMITVPRLENGKYQPLCAVYPKSCTQEIETRLKNDQLRIAHLFTTFPTQEIDEQELRKVDPGLDSFVNLNTPEDLQQAEKRTQIPGLYKPCGQ